jgi:FHA domain/zinc-ribbon domain
MSHVYCPECGFQNPESANYCSKCGALLVRDGGAETTLSYMPEEGSDDEGALAMLEDAGIKGPALVVRSGGGRAGETFHPEGERTTIGRSPDCEIFLDDVTVSRKHAVLTRRDGGFFIEDLGSLNGTFLNRHRIESAELNDGDELQIGKYRLMFLLK